MSSLIKRMSNTLKFKELFRENGRLKNWLDKDGRLKTLFAKDGILQKVYTHKKAFTYVGVATTAGITFVEYVGISAGCEFLKDLIKNIIEETGNKYIGYFTEKMEERERRKMIGNGVAHGLAWLHYFGYLQHVLPNLESKLEQSEWYQQLSVDKKQRLPRKLYELIPRKCSVNIPGTDDKMHHETNLVFNPNGDVIVQIYSIMEGETKYYCMCNCPYPLKTMNNVNDIQMAGISRSKYSNAALPWNRKSTVQLFTVDTKLVQLRRFYYALSSLLCLNNTNDDFGNKARLVLFNESEQKLSTVLLQTIREDLKEPTGEQKVHGSSMENTLLSSEECKDVFYEFDVFLSYTEDVHNKETLDRINASLNDKGLKVLSEKDCLGKNWLTKLKYAATKCRWVVFLEEKGSNSTRFVSSHVVDSLKSILESRKVQSVAVINKKNELHIHDDLRWATYIPYHTKEEDMIATLYTVVSGLEPKPENIKDLYLKPGELAIGLAWNFAANYLEKALAVLPDRMIKGMHDLKIPITSCKPKIYIVVPESCKTSEYIILDDTSSEQYTEPSYGYKDNISFCMYKIEEDKKTNYFIGQYARTVECIRQMNKMGLLNETEMRSELNTFYTTVDKIMEILLPEKTDGYEFVYFDDTKRILKDVMLERFHTDELLLVYERISLVVENM